jgi:hypothetical protein
LVQASIANKKLIIITLANKGATAIFESEPDKGLSLQLLESQAKPLMLSI